MRNAAPKATLAAPFVGLILAAAPAAAAPTVAITAPWILTPPSGAKTAAGYFTVANTGNEPDRLIGASSPAAENVQLHSMSMAGGIMRMRPVVGGLAVPPGQTIKFTPDGYHLMLINPRHALATGDAVAVTLIFAHAGALTERFPVRAAAPAAAPGSSTMSGMGPMH